MEIAFSDRVIAGTRVLSSCCSGKGNVHGSGACGLIVQLRSEQPFLFRVFKMEDHLRELKPEMVRMQVELTTARLQVTAAQQRYAATQPSAQAFSQLIDTKMVTMLRSVSGRE